MAIMIKVHKRGTDLKQNYRDDIKVANKKIRRFLTISIIVNVVLGVSIITMRIM